MSEQTSPDSPPPGHTFLQPQSPAYSTPPSTPNRPQSTLSYPSLQSFSNPSDPSEDFQSTPSTGRTQTITKTTHHHRSHKKTIYLNENDLATRDVGGSSDDEDQDHVFDKTSRLSANKINLLRDNLINSSLPTISPPTTFTTMVPFSFFFKLFKYICISLLLLCILLLIYVFLFHSTLPKDDSPPSKLHRQVAPYMETLCTLLETGCDWLETFSRSSKEYFSNLRLVATAIGSIPPVSKRPSNVAPSFFWPESRNFVKDFLLRLQKKFPHQSKDTWFQIYSALTSVMSEETPSQPASLIFLIPSKSSRSFASCLAEEIGLNVHSAFTVATRVEHSSEILHLSQGILREIGTVDGIHDKLDSYLRKGKVVIVEDVQEINEEDHLFIFHAYSDNFEAPDKRAVFIFLLGVPDEAVEATAEILKKGGEGMKGERQVGMELTELILDGAWSSLSGDKRPAIISRVASTIVMIQSGDECQEGFGNE